MSDITLFAVLAAVDGLAIDTESAEADLRNSEINDKVHYGREL